MSTALMIFDSGSGISTTSGHGDHSLGLSPELAEHAHQENLCDGPEACRRAVRLQIRRGADVIKIMTTGGVNSSRKTPRRPPRSVAARGKKGRRYEALATTR